MLTHLHSILTKQEETNTIHDQSASSTRKSPTSNPISTQENLNKKKQKDIPTYLVIIFLFALYSPMLVWSKISNVFSH